MAISTRWSPSPVTRPAHSPSIVARPSSSRPSSRKKSIVPSRSSTTIPDVVHPLERHVPPTLRMSPTLRHVTSLGAPATRLGNDTLRAASLTRLLADGDTRIVAQSTDLGSRASEQLRPSAVATSTACPLRAESRRAPCSQRDTRVGRFPGALADDGQTTASRRVSDRVVTGRLYESCVVRSAGGSALIVDVPASYANAEASCLGRIELQMLMSLVPHPAAWRSAKPVPRAES